MTIDEIGFGGPVTSAPPPPPGPNRRVMLSIGDWLPPPVVHHLASSRTSGIDGWTTSVLANPVLTLRAARRDANKNQT